MNTAAVAVSVAGVRDGEKRAAAVSRRAPEYLALGAVVLAQAVINWHFVSRSYFFVDDFKVLHDALVGSLSLHYLASEPVAHFSPGHRLVTLLLEQHAMFNYKLAAGFLLVVHSVAVVLVQRILVLWAGPRWWTYILAFAYGASILQMQSLQWWTAGLLTIPATAFTLAAIHANICWRRTGRGRWLAWSVLAVAGGLFFYEKAALIPLYLVLLRLLVLEPSEPVRDGARALRREWRTWLLYAVPLLAYVPAYLSRGYLQPWRAAPWADVLTYVRVSWLHAFVPGAFGVRLTIVDVGMRYTWVVIACQLGVVAIVASTIARARSAWRAWLFFAVVFLINSVIVLPRVAVFGPDVAGYVYRYLTEPAFLLVLVLGWVVAWPREAGPQRVDSSIVDRRQRAVRSPGAVLGLAVAGALAVYVVLVWKGDTGIIRDSPASASRSWVTTVRTDIQRARRGGLDPVLLDGPDPRPIGPLAPPPGPNFLSATVPDFIGGVRFDVVSDHTYLVAPDGHLRAVSFQPVVGGPVTQLSARTLLTVKRGDAAAFDRDGCLGSPQGWTSLELHPARPLLYRAWYLRSVYRTARGTLLLMVVDRGVGYPKTWDRALPSNPDGAPVLTNLGSIPDAVPTFSRLTVDVPPGRRVCFSSLAVGYYIPAAPR